MDKFGPKVAPKGMGGISPEEQADLDELLAIAAERAQMEDDISQRMPQTPEGSPGLIDANIDGLINQLAGGQQVPGSAEPDMVDPRDLLIERFDEPPGPAIWQGMSQGLPVAEKPPLMPGALGAAGYRAEPKPPEEERVDRYAPAPTAPEPEAAPDVSTPPAQAAPSDAAPTPTAPAPEGPAEQQAPRGAGATQEAAAPETAAPQTAEQTRDVIRGLPDGEGKRRATIAMSGQPIREGEDLERTLKRVNDRMSMLATLRDQYEDQRSRRMITNLMQGVARATLNYLRTSAGLRPQRGATSFARGAAEDRRRYEAARHQFQSQWEEADREARRLDSEERDSARRDRAEAREERGLEMREQQFSQEQAERTRILSLRDPNSEASAAERQSTSSALRSLREMFAAGRRNPRSDAILAGFSRYDEETLSQMNGEQLRELRERIASITTQGLQGFGRRGVGGGGGSGRSGRRRSGGRRGRRGGGGANLETRSPAGSEPALQDAPLIEYSDNSPITEDLRASINEAVEAARALPEDQMRRHVGVLQGIVRYWDGRFDEWDGDAGDPSSTGHSRLLRQVGTERGHIMDEIETHVAREDQIEQRTREGRERYGGDRASRSNGDMVYRTAVAHRARVFQDEVRRLIDEHNRRHPNETPITVDDFLHGRNIGGERLRGLVSRVERRWQAISSTLVNAEFKRMAGANVTGTEEERLNTQFQQNFGDSRAERWEEINHLVNRAYLAEQQLAARYDEEAVARYWLSLTGPVSRGMSQIIYEGLSPSYRRAYNEAAEAANRRTVAAREAQRARAARSRPASAEAAETAQGEEQPSSPEPESPRVDLGDYYERRRSIERFRRRHQR